MRHTFLDFRTEVLSLWRVMCGLRHPIFASFLTLSSQPNIAHSTPIFIACQLLLGIFLVFLTFFFLLRCFLCTIFLKLPRLARLLTKTPFQPTYSAITSHKMLQTSQSAEESIYGRKNISRGNANQRRRQFFSQAFKKNNFRQRGSASARYSDFRSCQYGSAGTLFRRADSHFHTAKKRRDPTNNRNGRHSGIP